MGGRQATEIEAARRRAEAERIRAAQEAKKRDYQYIYETAYQQGGLPWQYLQKIDQDPAMVAALHKGFDDIRKSTPSEDQPNVGDVQNLIKFIAATGGHQVVDTQGNTVNILPNAKLQAHKRDTDRTWFERFGGDVGNVFQRAWDFITPFHDTRGPMAPGSRRPLQYTDADGITRQVYLDDSNSLFTEKEIEAMYQPEGEWAIKGIPDSMRYRIPTNIPEDMKPAIARLQELAQEYVVNGDLKSADLVARRIQEMTGYDY
jgi:hypothetical protein